jgi:opacity protein-like surface antigen
MKMTRLKLLVAASLATLFLSSMAMAQEIRRSEVSGQVTGFIVKDTDGNGISQNSTKTLGALASYRFFFNRYVGVDGSYGLARNTLHNFTPTGAFNIQSDIHQVTGAVVVRYPNKISPYALAGAGALIFNPTDNPGGFVAGADRQTKPAFVYGGGTNIYITERFGIRAEYRGFVYKQADFGLDALNSDKYAHTAQPSVGFVIRF